MSGIKASTSRTDFLALSKNLTKTTSGFSPTFIKISLGQSIHNNLPFGPLSLNENLPIPLKPSASTKLARNKLGKPLVKIVQDADFDLTDPYLHKTKLDYKPLHDPALKDHFHRPVVLSLLQQKGFVSRNGDVLCSMKEFCDYVRYLGQLHSEQCWKVKSAQVSIFVVKHGKFS